MSQTSLCLRIENSELHAVPAVHFRHAFAEEVQSLCADSRSRPEAIAVELGPRTASAAAAWIRELYDASTGRNHLPCMLGLTAPNRRIHPSRRELARRIQETTGRELHELEPSVLKELLDYSAARVLYLSPVDSIIEAIRCSVELQVPLYGVDMDESAEAIRPTFAVQDPGLASHQVKNYIQRNQAYAESHRDSIVDPRRETVMAARLKTLLGRHQRVLFTGGLAHWVPLQTLLSQDFVEHEPEPQPAPVWEAQEIQADEFQRVVVHPLLALYHMDLFPALTTLYESRRKPVHLGRSSLEAREILLDASTVLVDALREAYRQHFGPQGEAEEQMDRQLEDWEACADFERLLANLNVVRQQSVPDLFTVMVAAQGVMSPQFCKTMAEILMEFDWASPEDFANLPVLAPAPARAGDFVRVEYVRSDGTHGKHFYIEPLPGGGGGNYTVKVPIPWQWQQVPPPPPEHRGARRSWAPRDFLTMAMSLLALDLAANEKDRRSILPFEGSLLDGVDVKTTLRAYTRGDDRVYIRDTRRRRSRSAQNEGNPFPIVWLFRPTSNTDSDWKFFGDDLRTLASYLPDPSRILSLAEKHGSWMTEGFAYVNMHPHPALPRNRAGEIEQLNLRGLLLYMPGHFSYAQYAAWAHRLAPRGSRQPHLPFPLSKMESGQDYLHREHNIDFQNTDWPTAMLRAAIPYAHTAVTVVAPDQFPIPAHIHQEAARYGVRFRTVPLSFLPRDLLQKISTYYFVPTVGSGSGNEYPDSVSRVLGEAPTDYRDWVPPAWLDFGQEDIKQS